MSLRFTLILVLITLTLLAWTFIHHQFEESVRHRLHQLSETPIFVYSTNNESLESLTRDLRNDVPQIDSLIVESGQNAARQMLRDYQLGIVPSTLEDYDFPDVLTIRFKPELASIPARLQVLEILARYKIQPEGMENQETAWNLFKTDLEYIRDRWSNTTIFIAFIVFLLFLFVRLYLLLAEPLTRKGITATILEALQKKEHKKMQTMLLLAVPILVDVVVYRILVAAKLIEPLAGGVFFLIQFAVVLTGTIVVMMLDSMRDTGDSEDHTFPLDLPHRNNALGS